MSFRFLFLALALVALFLGLRRSYLMTSFDLDEAVERARHIPVLLAFVAALVAAVWQKHKPGTIFSPALRGTILGSSVGGISCLALAIEFGELLRRMDYWDWSRDWIWIAPHLVIATVQGGAIGAFVLQVGWLISSRRTNRKAKLPARGPKVYNGPDGALFSVGTRPVARRPAIRQRRVG